MSPDKLSMIRWMGCWCCLAPATPDEGGMRVRKDLGYKARKKTRRGSRGGRSKGVARCDVAAPPIPRRGLPVKGSRRKRAYERRNAFSLRSVKICSNLHRSIQRIDAACKRRLGNGVPTPPKVRQKRHTLMLSLHRRKAAWIAFQVKASQDSLQLIKMRYNLLLSQSEEGFEKRYEYDSDLDSETESTNLNPALARIGETPQEMRERLDGEVKNIPPQRAPRSKDRPPRGMLSKNPDLDKAWRLRPALRGKPPCRHCGFAICRCATRRRT